MRIINLSLACLLGVVLVAPVAVMAGSFSFSDNFDDGDISDWTTVTSGTGVVEESTNRPLGGGLYSMHIESIQEGDLACALGNAGVFQNLDYSQAYSIDFDFNYDKNDDPNGFHFLEVMAMNAPGGTSRHVSLYLDRPDLNGQADELIYRDSTPANHSVAGLKEDIWYHLGIAVDPANETYDLTVSGPAGTQHVYDWGTQQWGNELTAPDIPFMGAGHGGGFFPFRFGDRNADAQTYDHGEAYWDNIAIDGEWIPEPATVILLAVSGLALLQRKTHS